jgi:hypothetical protein
MIKFVLALGVIVTAYGGALIAAAYGGEPIICQNMSGAGKWVYREIDGRRCWFPASGLRRGREKPREELSWPPPPVEALPVVSDPVDMRPPWELKRRWRGGAKEGWDHKE